MEDLLKEEAQIREILNEIEPLIMSVEAERKFQEATCCYICGRRFLEDPTFVISDSLFLFMVSKSA
jgi:hypothetical protein